MRTNFALAKELSTRKRKFMDLLHSILPPKICDKVQADEKVLTEFNHVTIMFCSIDNFDEFVQVC